MSELERACDALRLAAIRLKVLLDKQNSSLPWANEAREALAALEAHMERGGVPDGYVLVPREPTKEMFAAGYSELQKDDYVTLGEVWPAMLAAAPPVVVAP